MPSELESSLIVVSYNTRDQTLACVQSLLDGDSLDFEVLVVDNDSRDGTAEALKRLSPEVRVIRQVDNVGFARAANVGAGQGRGRYLGFFNSDCIARPGSVPRLVAFLGEQPMASAAAPRLVSTTGAVQTNIQQLPSVRSVAAEHLLGRVQDPYRAAELSVATEVEACSGAALMIRREDFLAVGGFYEDYFMYVEDVELCRRLSAFGKRIFYVPDAVLRHEGGASTGPNREALKTMLLRNRADYLRRTMSPARAALAVTALRLGTATTPLRTRLIAAARRT